MSILQKSRIWIFVLGSLMITGLQAQPDSSLLGDIPEPVEKVQNSFKTTKVVNLQSLEVTDAGVFDFKINHRFGPVNSGPYEFFGFDNAITRIGGEYGVIPNLMVGFGRSSYEKTLDGYAKYRIMHQTTDNKKPLSILIAGFIAYRGVKFATFTPTTLQRFSYVSSLILGRKFTEGLSVEIVPSIVHHNLTRSGAPNRQYAMGVGIRQKLTTRTTLNLEYIPVLSEKGTFLNSISAGFDIETGGHVFQLHFTNSVGNNEATFISRTEGDWMKGGFRFGFNISRVFTIVDPSRFSNNTY